MLNKVILQGRLTRDPELRTTQSGVATVTFSVAVDRSYSNGGEKKTDFIECNAWRGTAEFVKKYFSKGSAIIVEGELQNNHYTDKNGTKHYNDVVVVSNAHFGESKRDNNATTGGFTPRPTGSGFDDIEVGDDELPW